MVSLYEAEKVAPDAVSDPEKVPSEVVQATVAVHVDEFTCGVQHPSQGM
jgi:hypothetical protein